MATITDKASVIAAFNEFYAKIKPMIAAAKNGAVSEVEGKGYQTESDVQSAITNALAAYGNGDTEAF